MKTGEKITPQKIRVLYLIKILYEETDDYHYLTRKQIYDRLSGYGLELPDRDTFTDDIKQLMAFGIDIICDKIGRDNQYHIGGRVLELPEMKMIVDCIQSSRSLTEAKSKRLIRKVETYASRLQTG